MAKHVQDRDVVRAMEQVQSRHTFALRQAKTLTRNHAQMAQMQTEELTIETFMTARTMARLCHSSTSVADALCQGLQQDYRANEMHDMRNTVMANSMQSSSKGFNFSIGQQEGGSAMGGSSSGMGNHGGDSGSGVGGYGGDSGSGTGGHGESGSGGIGGGSGGTGSGGGSGGGHM
jgi:hypothetical protein